MDPVPTPHRVFAALIAALPIPVLVALLWPALVGPSIGAQSGSCVASTSHGHVQGVARDAACAYLGIPYAAPPTGPRRWRPPQPRSPWAPAVLPVVTTPPICPQLNLATGSPAGNEDCLTLNLWTPVNTVPGARLPVLVWLHTGGFQAASSNFPASDGQRFAAGRSAVVVAPNYRLGPFGFLAHRALTAEDPAYPGSGNYGLADQRAALAWVRQNVEAFGGDPGNVTLGGTSAGAESTSLHLVSPASRGLFHRAIVESGNPTARQDTDAEAEAQGDAFAAALGCTDEAAVLSCLRAASRDQVLSALRVGTAQILEDGRAEWGPSVDGLEVPNQPRELYRQGLFSRVPLIIGVQRDEGWTFVDRSFPGGLDTLQYERVVRTEFGMDASAVLATYPASAYPTPKDALASLTGDVDFVCEARRIARAMHHDGAPVYVYSFEYPVAGVTAGRVSHGLESNFVFGNRFAVAPNLGITAPRDLTPADLEVSDTMGAFWRRFIETGDPNPRGRPVQWPSYRPGPFDEPVEATRSDRHFVFADRPGVSNYLRDSFCNFWEPFFFRTAVGAVPAVAR